MRVVAPSASPEAVGEAKHLFFAGRPFVFPTETVYGLGCRPGAAEEGVYGIKGRPRTKPLTLHCSSLDLVVEYLGLEEGRDILRRLLPGPVNVITGKGVGVRVFEHPFIRAFCREVREPLAATSANTSSLPSHVTAESAYADLGDAVPLYLDGGRTEFGIESTVLDLRGRPRILRPGAMPPEAIEDALGEEVEVLPPRGGGSLGGKIGIFVRRGARIPILPRSVTVGVGEGRIQVWERGELYPVLWELIRDPTVRYVIFLEPDDLVLKHRMFYFSQRVIKS